MLQSKQRLLQLNAKLAETLTSKGVTATADETTTALVNKVSNITSGDTIYFSNDGRMYTKNIILPEGLTEIGNYFSKTKGSFDGRPAFLGYFLGVFFTFSIRKRLR